MNSVEDEKRFSDKEKRYQSSAQIVADGPFNRNNRNYKSSEMLLVGEGDQKQPLALHFRKKQLKSDSSNGVEATKKLLDRSVSKPNAELSKLDLRKKMMEYGKKLDHTKKSTPNILPTAQNDSPQKRNSSNKMGKDSSTTRKASPKPEVLERLSRGIKPKVEKAEIYQITRRHMEKFSKLNNRPESPSATQHKRAELMERRLRVKELDQVGLVH